MKEIISNIELVLDAQKPTELHKVLFTQISSFYDSGIQSEVFKVNSYKIINEAENTLEFIKTHTKTVNKAVLDTMRASMTITATNYTDVRNEEMVKGMAIIIDSDRIFGLTTADITLR